MTANNITNGILAGLTKIANYFVQIMKQRLSSGNYPNGNSDRGTVSIQDAISIGTAQQAGDRAFIDVEIDLKKAPAAAAFEWGSGIHTERGVPGLYPILPKNASALSIPRSRWQNYNPPPDIDPVFVRKVMHPGVAPRPYIAPSIIDSKEEVRKILGKEVKAAIMLGVPPVTVIEVKL